MDKEEIIRYAYENCELPQDALQYLSDTEFLIEILEAEPSIMFDLPLEVQKQILLINDKYLDEVEDITLLFEDEEFAKTLIDKNNDLLLKLRGISLDNEYIKNLIISYIRGEVIPAKGSKLEKISPRRLYMSATKEVQQDYETALYLIEQDIRCLPDIKIREIHDNPQYINEYVKNSPAMFPKYVEQLSNNLTPEVIESALKHNFQNYSLIDRNNPLMEQFYESIDRIKAIRPELKMDNPNLRYELLCDLDFVNMDINILNSLLEYNTGNVDKIIEIKNSGKLEYLTKYIEQYNGLYGNTLENIQNAISSFEQMEQLLINTNNFDGIEINEEEIKTIISAGNKFNIETVEDLHDYEGKVKKYYDSKLQEATSIEAIKSIYAEMLFNTSVEELEKFNEQYCNYNMTELVEYSKKNELESPISEEFQKRQELYNRLMAIQDVEELRSYFSSMPLISCAIEETKKKIASMYSKSYTKDMIDLEDETLEHQDYQGVDVIKLNGQSFNIFIHRIFNFDFNMTSIANAIIENPEQWRLMEGSSTVSTTFITDKKIAAIFREMNENAGTKLVALDTYEKLKEYEKDTVEKARQICEGEKLKEIEEDAVFYGFTELVSDGIVKMDSTDMMVQHGKGHLTTNTSNCRFRATEDLAYWTRADYWNEVAQKRKETNIDKADILRNQKGTDRMQPSCIICFDGNINEKSVLAAKVHNIPIVMIDRQAYLDINNQKLEEAKLDFSKTLSISSIEEIFYRQPYNKIVEDMPRLINAIKNNSESSLEDKTLGIEYLAYLAQHFIEQSSGYIINTPVEEYNSKMQEYIKILDRELPGQNLVTIDDMKSAYIEISASDRKRRYEAVKNDIMDRNREMEDIKKLEDDKVKNSRGIRQLNSKEGENTWTR